MRTLTALVLALLSFATAAQAQDACEPAALATAARQVAVIRQHLQTVAVKQNDPNVPASVADQLQALKAALTTAADAALRCARPDLSPEDLEATLATALHANNSSASDTVLVTRDHRDEGAYGSDLAVQVFPLYSSPRFYELDFRYGVECGDDNLLMIYEAGGTQGPGWHPVLRWGAPAYTTVGSAFGDFVLLTPLSGFAGDRNWRFVVAHGEPGCTGDTAPSRFDLDLLEPTADPAHPQIVWHLQHHYTRNQVPRLSTTEDTLTFQLSPPDKAKTASAAETFRFHVSRNNQVTAGAPDDTSAEASNTHSPQ